MTPADLPRPLHRLREEWRGHLRRRTERRMAGPRLLRAFAEAYPDAYFVEIGANDGALADPLRPHVVAGRWRGIMVEPAPGAFERLRRNHADNDRVVLENVAIADHDGTVALYHLPDTVPAEVAEAAPWYAGVGSLSREHVVESANVPGAADLVERTEVPCITFESLCRRNSVERIDLLLIDTEGYDWEILKGIDFEAWRPRMVVYEHAHLGQDDREAARAMLTALGYAAKEEYMDTWCLDAVPDDHLTRMWLKSAPAVPGIPVAPEGA